jgi:hypothetical protein
MNAIRRAAIALMAVCLLLAAHALPGVNSTAAAQSLTTIADTQIPGFSIATPNVPKADTTTPDEFYHSAWKAVKNNFLWQDRLTDWDKWEHTFDGQLNSIEDAERAINQALGTLNDGYTYYKNATVTSASNSRSDRRNVVTHQMLPGKIGYIKITTFGSNHVADEVKAALQALSGAEAYIIDLRDNGGGYIWQAFRVFSLFADQGEFTSLKGTYNGSPYTEKLVVTTTNLENTENGSKTTSAREANLTGKKPIRILLNGDSASASEMFSGAMRDNGRAKLIGTRTYGKGIAQITLNLAHGASVQVTFAEYFIPSGANIHGKGLDPDTAVVAGSTGDTQQDEAVKQLNKELGR